VLLVVDELEPLPLDETGNIRLKRIAGSNL